MSALSIYVTEGFKEYADIIVTEATGKDISAGTFQVALVLSSAGGTVPPLSGWITPSINIAGQNSAQRILKLLISSTDAPTTAPGTYYLWARITDNPEIIPQRRPSTVTAI